MKWTLPNIQSIFGENTTLKPHHINISLEQELKDGNMRIFGKKFRRNPSQVLQLLQNTPAPFNLEQIKINDTIMENSRKQDAVLLLIGSPPEKYTTNLKILIPDELCQNKSMSMRQSNSLEVFIIMHQNHNISTEQRFMEMNQDFTLKDINLFSDLIDFVSKFRKCVVSSKVREEILMKLVEKCNELSTTNPMFAEYLIENHS
ncbi:unnamed protein product [Caenorhabditis angaria]|uniref:Uncharacterized protein n=1 Tax=Caenorhabditis angaria TaxID=860376 RepID=A0A9P1MTH3_9PELO|nr:unnamed protein product [Caenorhabditis angaria]